MPLSDDAASLGEPDLLKERDVGGGCSKVLSSASPAVRVNGVNGKEARLAEVIIGDGGGGLATRRVEDGSL